MQSALSKNKNIYVFESELLHILLGEEHFQEDKTNYIKEVYETIVTRDLVQKYALPDTLVL